MPKNKVDTIYVKIKDELKQNIKAGELKPGHRVMTESEICTHYGVSRASARKALNDLMKEGYIYRVAGSGSFVSSPPIDHLLYGFYNLTEEIKKRGMTPSMKILDFREVSIKDTDFAVELNQKLFLPNEEHVYYLKRLRLADNEVIALDKTYLSIKYFPSLTAEEIMEGGSLYVALSKKYSCIPNRGQEYFSACSVNKQDARDLNVNPGSAALNVVRVAYFMGNPIEYYSRIYRGEKFYYRVDLQNIKSV